MRPSLPQDPARSRELDYPHFPPALAENFWRSIEATLFRDGVSAVEHMVAYAVPAG